jgi:hypothetical protein
MLRDWSSSLLLLLSYTETNSRAEIDGSCTTGATYGGWDKDVVFVFNKSYFTSVLPKALKASKCLLRSTYLGAQPGAPAPDLPQPQKRSGQTLSMSPCA